MKPVTVYSARTCHRGDQMIKRPSLIIEQSIISSDQSRSDKGSIFVTAYLPLIVPNDEVLR